ncbi:MAG: CHAT domain-containing protein [Gammaproteobacteria bacterium]
MTDAIPLALTARPAECRLPPLLGAVRATAAADDAFLPEGFLRATGAFDLGAAARGDPQAQPLRLQAAADELVYVELADGGVLLTSAGRLRDALARRGADPAGTPIALDDLLGAVPAGRGPGAVLGRIAGKVYTFVASAAGNAIGEAAAAKIESAGGRVLELGVTWAGTRALMWAIEERLDRRPGLYRWRGRRGGDALAPVDAAELRESAAAGRPMLVFVHGTASSTRGSFEDLRDGDPETWNALEARYTGGILAYEHRTLSQSPIENALDLARALPAGARIALVSHSRGGLVADLMCCEDLAARIDDYARPPNLPGLGSVDPGSEPGRRIAAWLDAAHAEQRGVLRELAAELERKRLSVERYVRVASPANGTSLAGGNLDLFLSGMLTLLGRVPVFFGSPLYAAFKRVVIEIARNRTDPHMVPGIEAMLPDSPMARLLRDAAPRAGVAMSVIAGDAEGSGLLGQLGVLLADTVLFDRGDNDLVVDTAAMLAGVAPRAGARVLFDRGPEVSHFRYFANTATRAALRDWLLADVPAVLDAFQPLPSPGEFAQALATATHRDAVAAQRPVVVVLPGVMGSHLAVGGKDRVWFDPLDIATGGLAKIAWGAPGVAADDLFEMFYGRLCEVLARTHHVVRFAYDWRQPLDVLGAELGARLQALMAQTAQPIRLLAHSMGGLVVRACIHRVPETMDALMARDGSRLVMLGTPHQGAHSMVANLIGKGDSLRMLVRLDLSHDMQEVLDIVAGFRGALQLLPKPGFRDTFQGDPDGGELHDYRDPATWAAFRDVAKDFWFGDGRVGQPSREAIEQASWLWTRDGRSRPALPAAYEGRSAYVFGVARNTPCGVRVEGGRLKLVGTTRGDGTVTWDSGRIGGIGAFYYMPVEHGDLLSTAEHFPAIADLLATGATARLATTPPASRDPSHARAVSYDAGPPLAVDAYAIARSAVGAAAHGALAPRRSRRLRVRVRAMDLRFIDRPILAGHYEQDPIAGPQKLIDREILGGDLSDRYDLGLYAGPLGTATVVLRGALGTAPGGLRGAIVTGLGPYDRPLSREHLTEAVRAGALRYLLQVIDIHGESAREVPLATLLLGFNSTANLTVEAATEAIVRGVMEANARFFEITRLDIRIADLEIVELYRDTAITAVYALRRLQRGLEAQAAANGTRLDCEPELAEGEGVRQRLFDAGGSSYWPRLIVTQDGGENVAAAAVRTAPVDRLRFVYVGQRARAETVVRQRQPDLIEQFVRQQIRQAIWDEDFGRVLFQQIVPAEFKEAARQFERLVLVVDRATANLPWELMLADDPARADDDPRPLAVRMAMVRQLSSAQFRRQVRQGARRTALVVGNPSVAGFKDAFQVAVDPPDLPAAQAESEATGALLRGAGYDVALLADRDPARAVFGALHHQPWRILHVSGHGVFALAHRDGRPRSGVALSDGLLITAADIAALEYVPELVFLNCCHLGTVESGDQGNKLAASLAAELIDIGVRCVVVAGWAVSDDLAALFGEVFYRELLVDGRPFGEAVFAARRAAWSERSQDITWGAFQAYGDPDWRPDPRPIDGEAAGAAYASVDELLDALARIRVDFARRATAAPAPSARDAAASVQALLRRRCTPQWAGLPLVQAAIGETWYDLGRFDRARESLLAALAGADGEDELPIRILEKIADAETRLAAGGAAGAEALVDAAIARLNQLQALIGTADTEPAAERRRALMDAAVACKAALRRRVSKAPGKGGRGARSRRPRRSR